MCIGYGIYFGLILQLRQDISYLDRNWSNGYKNMIINIFKKLYQISIKFCKININILKINGKCKILIIEEFNQLLLELPNYIKNNLKNKKVKFNIKKNNNNKKEIISKKRDIFQVLGDKIKQNNNKKRKMNDSDDNSVQEARDKFMDSYF